MSISVPKGLSKEASLGRYKEKCMRVNENRSRATRGSASDIAQVLGVSKAAVSYALNGKPGISDETRRSIIELARAYGIEVPERATNMHYPLIGRFGTCGSFQPVLPGARRCCSRGRSVT